ncbi:MAG: cytochrome c, partial [Pirellula sp.]
RLQGDMPNNSKSLAVAPSVSNKTADRSENSAGAATGKAIWKNLVSDATIEDLVKESKSRLDSLITSPAKFAGGGVTGARREFTLLASLMAVISQYPEEIRWQPSASYAQRIFARVALNCKVGTQAVFNEAKLRQQDLQNLLKGTKLTGNAEEVSWADTADRGPTMLIMEWALRDNLAPSVNADKKFRENSEEVLKYAELISMLGNILVQQGMSDADDEQYAQFAATMIQAAQDVSKAARTNDPELARTAAGRLDQACGKCHETYK